MPAGHNFEHLPLILSSAGLARFPQAPTPLDPATEQNRQHRANHSQTLSSTATSISTTWGDQQAERQKAGLPATNAGIPLLLKIDTSLDIDELRRTFEFEVVSEQEDGFVIVASEDIALSAFQTRLTQFAQNLRGSANVARILELDADPNQSERLRRILSPELLSEWTSLQDTAMYIVEIGVACVGNWQIPNKPSRGRRTDETWAHAEAEWSQRRIEAYDRWDDLRDTRVAAIIEITKPYDAQILGNFHNDPADVISLPDSFTLRLKIAGAGLKDLILNYPYIFEVTGPDDIETPQQQRRDYAVLAATIQIHSPGNGAPPVCIIDSGVQEEHLWLEPGIDKGASRCFLENAQPTDVADYVASGGHGTRVAGAVLHGEQVATTGSLTFEVWVQNARVLDADNELPEEMFPPAVLREVVEHYHKGPRHTRIFNHSINANSPCRLIHMSAWAAEIDSLCDKYDVLIIQSAGNLRDSQPAPMLGIAEFISNGQPYPEYLSQPASRIANPGQSFQALTVGSVAYGSYSSNGWHSFATQAGDSSAFSRSGLAIWDCIKPEVVEYGGDSLYSQGGPPSVGTPDVANVCYPELVRSTLHGGPPVARDDVGTSFAAPKVSRLAAKLQALLPDASCLLYRALIVQSASWPAWSTSLTPPQQSALLRRIGYGIPSIDRATTNTDHRTTFITQKDYDIAAGDCHVFQVPIPEELRHPGNEFDIRVEVTLSYVAEPRRTRRTHRGYLSVWLDWVSNRKGESIEAFLSRALKGDLEPIAEGTSIEWTIGARGDWGILPGVHRSVGTVQKDWAMLKSNALPEDFCIAVRAHRGWSRDPESAARYALTVSFEIVGKEIPIYEPLRNAVLELQSEIQASIEEEAIIQVEG